MHFWIDKRSQCGYSGRHRVPPSLSAGVGRSRGRVGVGVGRKGMVTPVHRFQAVDCVPPPRVRRTSYRYYGPPPMPAVHASSRRAAGGADVFEEPPTLQTLAAQRMVTPDTLLRTAALGLHRPPELMSAELKFGMWSAFTLATLFVGGAKFYFDHQARVIRGDDVGNASGNSGVVVCAVVGALVLCVCALSLCRARPAPLAFPDRVSSTAHRPPLTPTREPSDDISLGTLLQTVSSERTLAPDPPPPGPSAGEAPPPPYHIAVLLPPSAAAEPPPPAYSAIS